MDCSSFVCKAYHDAGLADPGSTTVEILDKAKRDGRLFNDAGLLSPGDLVMFHTGHGPNGMHVGIYIGNGKMRQESSAAGKVVETSLASYPYKPIGFVRKTGLKADATVGDLL